MRSPMSRVAAVAVFVMCAVVAGCGSDQDSARLTTKRTTARPPSVRVSPDTPWSEATLSRDGRTLVVAFNSSPPGDGPCHQNFVHDVVETGESVTISFEEQPAPATSEKVACPEIAFIQQVRVTLEEPLGDRKVYDGIQTTPRTVFRMADLVAVTSVPSGFVAEKPAPRLDRGHPAWQQTFMRGGADWYFFVGQEAAGLFHRLDPHPTPVTVHGITGERYGLMSGTAQTIHWVEGGLDLSVTGEMQGPPSFTHDDELLQIAEGVRPPAGG